MTTDNIRKKKLCSCMNPSKCQNYANEDEPNCRLAKTSIFKNVNVQTMAVKQQQL